MKPITPNEIQTVQNKCFPDETIEAFNELIVANWDGYSATILQKDVVEKISYKLNITKNEVYDSHYLNVEDIFRKAGWKVKYDKPGYCEIYNAFYLFSK